MPNHSYALALVADQPTVVERLMSFIYNKWALGSTYVIGYQPQSGAATCQSAMASLAFQRSHSNVGYLRANA